MRIIKTILFLICLCLISSIGYGQYVNFGATRIQDTSRTIGSLRANGQVIFPFYSTSDSGKFFGINSNGYLVLRKPSTSGISLTTNGTSGASTLIGSVLNIPVYTSQSVDTTRIYDSLQTKVAKRDSGVIYTTPYYVNTLLKIRDSVDTVIFQEISDLQQDKADKDTLANFVPYTNATGNVNLGEYNIKSGAFVFDTTPTGTPFNGVMYWDATNVTPQVQLNTSVTMQIGQEMYVRARNNTGVQINDGQVVYINGAQGNNATIELANSDSVNTSQVIGVATENIGINSTGFVTTYGTVNGYNTSDFNSGDVLYLSATNGQITNNIPTPPHNVVRVGYALNSTNNGRIFVNPSQPISQDTTMGYNSNKVAPTQRSVKTYVDNKFASAGTVSSIRFVGGTGITVSPTTAITSTGVVTITGTAGTVTSVGTSFGLSGGTITTSGTILVDTTNVPTQYRVDTASRNARIVALSRGTVSSIATGFGLSGGTITTSGTLIVDTTNVPTQYRVDTASRNARTVALGRVSSVSGTSGRISSTGGTTPVLDLVTVNATPATYGGSNAIPVVAVDAYGRATSITTVTPVTTTAITTTNFTTSYTIAATDSRPILLTITAQAGDLTFNAPTGLTDGQLVLIRIKATGSSRALTWNGAFGAIAGPTAVALPTTVTTTAFATMQFIFNSTDNKLYLSGYVTN